MVTRKELQEYWGSKEYLIQRLEKYLEKGIVYRTEFPIKQVIRLKKLGLIVYNERRPHYDIKMDVYNELKKELEDDKRRV